MRKVEEIRELGPTEQKNVNKSKVVEVLPTLGSHGEKVAEIVHDARNIITALDLYCDLLEDPGVLTSPFAHYSGELRLVAAASRRLVDKLSIEPAETSTNADAGEAVINLSFRPISARNSKWQHGKNVPAEPIGNLAQELFANRTLLTALAGPTIGPTVDARGGAVPVRMTSEGLIRNLVNLVKNSAADGLKPFQSSNTHVIRPT